MCEKLFLCAGFLLLAFYGCSEKLPENNNSISNIPVEKTETENRSEITFDFSIELIGDPIDTTGEVWNVKGIDIYTGDSSTPIQQIKHVNTLTPVGGDFSGGFMVEDYNFDGKSDFRLIKLDPKTKEIKFHFWLFDKKENGFVPCFQLDSLPAPQFDYANHFVLSEFETDSSLISDTYKFSNQSLVLEERNVKIFSQQSISIRKYKTEKGQLILVDEKHLTGKWSGGEKEKISSFILNFLQRYKFCQNKLS